MTVFENSNIERHKQISDYHPTEANKRLFVRIEFPIRTQQRLSITILIKISCLTRFFSPQKTNIDVVNANKNII